MASLWKTIDLAGHQVELFAPPEQRTDAAVLVLPDQGQRASGSAALAAALARSAIPAIAPVAERCWWLDRVEPDFDPELPPLRFLLEQVIPLAERQFAVRPPHVKLLGWGTGGQGVFQLAFRRSREYPSVAAINPAIDFHELHGRGTDIDQLFPSREAARQDTALLRLHPAAWPRWMQVITDRGSFWFEGAEKLDMKLRSMGIPIDSELTQTATGDAHEFFEQQVGRAIDFLLKERFSFPVVRPET